MARPIITINGEINWVAMPPGSKEEFERHMADTKQAIFDIITMGAAFVPNPLVRAALVKAGYKEVDPNEYINNSKKT